jgi:hypothetical protein
LAGRWTIIGDDQVHSETLTKLVEPVPGEPGASDPLNAPTPPRRRAPHPVAGTIAS